MILGIVLEEILSKPSRSPHCFIRFCFDIENIWIQNVLAGYFMTIASQVNMKIFTEIWMFNFLSDIWLNELFFFFCLKLPLLALGNCNNFDFSHFIDKLILKLLISDISCNKHSLFLLSYWISGKFKDTVLCLSQSKRSRWRIV